MRSMNCRKTIFSLLFLILNSNIFATEPDSVVSSKTTPEIERGTLKECSVLTKKSKLYSNVKLMLINDSTVKVWNEKTSVEIPVKDINSIKIHNNGLGTGAMIVGGVGFVLGFFVGGYGWLDSHNESNQFEIGTAMPTAFVLGFAAFILGGGVSNIFAADKLFDLADLDLKDKKDKILVLIKEFSDR